MIVADASFLSPVVGDDGELGAAARLTLEVEPECVLPTLADIEVVSVLRKQWLALESGTCAHSRRLHNAIMTNVLVRDVPEPIHRRLTARAASKGQSLQAYLQMELMRLAETEPLEDVLARIRTRSGGRIGFQEAVDALDEARAER